MKEKQVNIIKTKKEMVKEYGDSGIPELQEILKLYGNGEIDFTALVDKLWNTGYKFGKEDFLLNQ